jgi:hypothetical protein
VVVSFRLNLLGVWNREAHTRGYDLEAGLVSGRVEVEAMKHEIARVLAASTSE